MKILDNFKLGGDIEDSQTVFAEIEVGIANCIESPNLTDADGMLDVVVWSDLYKRIYAVLASSEGLRVTGKVQANYGVFSVIATKIESATFS